MYFDQFTCTDIFNNTSYYNLCYAFPQQLETELRKLQGMIQDSMQGFDDTLTQLFMKKIKIMMVIYQVCSRAVHQNKKCPFVMKWTDITTNAAYTDIGLNLYSVLAFQTFLFSLKSRLIYHML